MSRVIFPFAVYYLVYYAAYTLCAFLLTAAGELLGASFQESLLPYQATIRGCIGGVCMLLAILPLRRSLHAEVSAWEKHRCGIREALPVILLAVCAALGLNIVLSLTEAAEQSTDYQRVAQEQYQVAVAAGVILYGIISPLAEEAVFRGILFNRLREDFPLPVAVCLSGLLFGLYHGNLVQGVYGAVMGMLMAYLYAVMGSFGIPLLFHAAANLTVYLLAQAPGLQEKLFNAQAGILLLALTVMGLLLVRNRRQPSA